MIDIGINLHNQQFSHVDLKKMFKQSYDKGIHTIVLTSVNFDTFIRNLNIIKNFHDHPDCPKLYTSFGHHPHRAKDFNQDLLKLINWANHQNYQVNQDNDLNQVQSIINATIEDNKNRLGFDPIVFIGEIGLDYERNISSHQQQKEVFEFYLQLNQSLKYPLFLHERNAFDDFNHIMKKESKEKAIVHCFTGSPKELQHYIKEGYLIGLTGFVTNLKRSENIQDMIENIPLNQLLLETDAPYMKPRNLKINKKDYLDIFTHIQEPEKIHQINLPIYIEHIYEYVAQKHQIKKEHLVHHLNENFSALTNNHLKKSLQIH